MITLNDYLYSGDTLLRILKKYIRDLRTEAKEKHNEIDLVHCNFLIQIQELLEHNDFLTAQSQKIQKKNLMDMWWSLSMIIIKNMENILLYLRSRSA